MDLRNTAYKIGLVGFVTQAVVFLSLFFQAWFVPGKELLMIIGPQEALIEMILTLAFLPFEIYFFIWWGLFEAE